MKSPWFRRVGILYMPLNLFSWLIMLSGIAFTVYRFLDIDSRSHSASDTLRPFFINLIMIFIAYTAIAALINSLPGNRKGLMDK